ncbi:predicted protein [Postia placenta Mad-698-R]|uniref:Uncharacterized protein n=1 Tax=Postia placenta MAD-698-R-SB12 TaxID=670580 RepID=A0A1X6NIB9_9APHY|nr:hypothetical protein POSPLADRAFT_1127548 [Postia placenta MAD-698-R-SB12]EED85734.1 predicted protein [Postia placenta Mad-698-R]OSX68186.1 hypothetical protein POSPLADRAFT_1127548 [Postia placenta MAD-698-R-SB12]
MVTATMLYTVALWGFLPILTSALVNDWSIACTSGYCFYDIDGPVTGTLYIAGDSNAISDITTAAGWTILDCDPSSTNQTIRAVCSTPSAGCDHLFQGGAVGTIVRLPENDHEDQTISSTVRRMFPRDDVPTVLALTVDTDFSAVNPQEKGSVAMSIHASYAGGTATGVRVGGIEKRVEIGTSAPALTIDAHGNLFNETLTCISTTVKDTSITCGISLGVDVQATLTVLYGIELNGTLIPPNTTDFSMYAGLDGDLDGTILVNSSAEAAFSTGLITLYQDTLPIFTIPDILTFGPSIQIDAEGTADLDVQFNAAVESRYTIDNATFVFNGPPNSTSGGSFGSSAPTVNITAVDASASASVTVKLVPTLLFGLTALADNIVGTINFELETFTTLDLTLGTESISGCGNSANKTSKGCVSVHSGVDVSADVDGQFFDLFQEQHDYPLYSKNFTVFQPLLAIHHLIELRMASGDVELCSVTAGHRNRLCIYPGWRMTMTGGFPYKRTVSAVLDENGPSRNLIDAPATK